jgi:hypothetical protein
MAGKATALEAFELNMTDATLLVDLAQALTNRRSNRLRKEPREAIGTALRIAKKHHDVIDCVESGDFFVVLKPGAQLSRDALRDMRPLLRQALVAGCAAIETYAADRVMELVGPVLRSKEKPDRLLDIRMSVRDWIAINEYAAKGWGIRQVLDREIRLAASPAPAQIGIVFATVGEQQLLNRVDAHLNQRKGTATEVLATVYERRNRIAHQGDRVGHGRARITIDEVRDALIRIRRIIEAIDAITPNQAARKKATRRRA